MEGQQNESAVSRRQHVVRVCIGVAVIAAVVGVVLIPARSSNDHAPPGQAALTRILVALSHYTAANEGRYPPPDQIAQHLIANGHLSPDALPNTGSPAYFFVTPQNTEFRQAQPLLYTNPGLSKDGSISVGYNDHHVEWLSPIQSRAFLTSVAPRAIPIK
ncbi:MAG: hypothetical protein KF678_14455 [Phycisphaeraceae bacterium]|nr:hypothetical protein [Phycisphaeraceae bacterium]